RCRFFFFQAEDGIRDLYVTGVQTCALPICRAAQEIGGAVVVKSQVLTGGRMKAGGVRFADTPEQAERDAAEILELEINGQLPRRSEERRVGKECRSLWVRERDR